MPHPAPFATAADRDRLHDEAAALFQPHTTRTLTREDGREITHNLIGFCRVLLKWHREDQARNVEMSAATPAAPAEGATTGSSMPPSAAPAPARQTGRSA